MLAYPIHWTKTAFRHLRDLSVHESTMLVDAVAGLGDFHPQARTARNHKNKITSNCRISVERFQIRFTVTTLIVITHIEEAESGAKYN
jgi:mRNA-degrading endonuclease RelE of RelBE toxin-antitoxin system